MGTSLANENVGPHQAVHRIQTNEGPTLSTQNSTLVNGIIFYACAYIILCYLITLHIKEETPRDISPKM